MIEVYDLTAEKVAVALLWDGSAGTYVEVHAMNGGVKRVLVENATAGVAAGQQLGNLTGHTVVIFLVHARVLPRRSAA